MNNVIGIDIPKHTFDVYFEQDCHLKLMQTEQDYQVLRHLIGKDAHCFMEATGNYNLRLAHYLHHCDHYKRSLVKTREYPPRARSL